MTLREFVNRAKALRFVDYDQFEATGVAHPKIEWPPFTKNPVMWLCLAPDAEAQKVWDWLDAREPPGQEAAGLRDTP